MYCTSGALTIFVDSNVEDCERHTIKERVDSDPKHENQLQDVVPKADANVQNEKSNSSLTIDHLGFRIRKSSCVCLFLGLRPDWGERPPQAFEYDFEKLVEVSSTSEGGSHIYPLILLV